ncbi:MAG TPA: hypothetical protein PLY66_05430 [Acidobacteriota bacterium]|nr:hypothetical protein [Acidobacteriota bacterium]HQF86373.1 hypothetical protein [Acidobacteriota bacterium]HQG90384.1 hypothetical protein [Acidobacteriota bacterium]
MKRLLVACLLGIGSLALALGAQSPGKIIDKYRTAIGGKAVKAVRATEWSGTAVAPDGRTGRFALRMSVPDRYRLDVELGAVAFTECYNGMSAWRRDAAGLRTLVGGDAAALRLRALLTAARLGDLSRHRIRLGPTVRTVRVEDRAAVAVDLTQGEETVTLVFDSANYLLLRQERRTDAGTESWQFDDFRRVDGVLEPYALAYQGPAGEFRVTLARVSHGSGLAAETFRFPAEAGGRPLPDPAVLLREISANQEKNARMRERYTFRENRTVQEMDGSGRVKKTEATTYDVTPVNGAFVERLVSKNGKPLSAKEQAKEDKRVAEQVEKMIKDSDRKSKRRGSAAEEDAVLIFLRAAEIHSLRREQLHGQEVIAFDFEPRADFKPRNQTETLLGKLAGTIWVDEDAREVARVEARLTDKFKIGGGLLASVAPNTRFLVEQRKVAGEVWLPHLTDGNIAARVLLVSGVNVRVVSRFSDYQKVQVNVNYEIPPPSKAD